MTSNTLLPTDRVRISAISDTFILRVSSATEVRSLVLLCEFVATAIMRGYQDGIYMRGAISVGSYWENGNMVVGEPIKDAAKYQNFTEWSGAIITPSCQARVAKVIASSGGKELAKRLVSYRVPCKSGIQNRYRRRILLALNWPHLLDSTPVAQSRNQLSKQILREIEVHSSDPRVKRKYLWTLQFLRDIRKKTTKKLKLHIPGFMSHGHTRLK